MIARLLEAVERRPRAALVAATLAAGGWSLWWLVGRYVPDPEFDAKVYYLPFAAQFLAEPATFLATEHSAWVTPMSFLYPALLGANVAALKSTNIALFLVLIALVFRTAERLHSVRAGVAAAAILALSPLVKPLIPTALTEPPFLFLVGTWLWALAESSPHRRWPWGIVAGLALGLATLTRQTYLFFIVAAIVVSGALAIRGRGEQREVAQFYFLVHVLAAALPLAAIARNAWLFGYPSIATGSGAALYFGHHMLTLGYDANYFGLVSDGGLVTGELSHLSIAGDRMLRAAGLAAIADTPSADLARMYLTKLGAFLFVTQAEVDGPPALLRAWRIALLAFAAWGWWRIRRPDLRLLLGVVFLYQIAIHIPVLYVHRYSVGAIDLPLALVAAVGIADAVTRVSRFAIPATVAALGIAAGIAHARLGAPLVPHIDDIPRLLAWSAERDPAVVTFGGQAGFRTPLVVTPGNRSVVAAIRAAPLLHPWDSAVLVAEVRHVGGSTGRCRSIAYSFRRKDEKDFGAPYARRLREDASTHADAFAASSYLKLNTEGDLRLDFDCDPGAPIRLEALWIAAPRFGLYYRIRSLGQPPTGELVLPERP